jgi:hypothetical protein
MVVLHPDLCSLGSCLVLSCLVSLECTLRGLFLAHAAAGLHCTVRSITPPWAGCSGLMLLNHLGALCGSYTCVARHCIETTNNLPPFPSNKFREGSY